MITPTFILKGIDPQKLLADYFAGEFIVSVPKEKILIAKNNTILAPIYGTSDKEPIFTVKDKNNNNIIVATSGFKNFEIFTKTGGNLPIGGRCDCCKKDFDHTILGYPVAYQEQTILVNTDSGVYYRIVYVFWIDGEFCSFEHALTEVRRSQCRSADHRDPTIRDSETMLKMMYRLMYPNGEKLRPSKARGLLQTNGGSLTPDQWKDPKYIYRKTERIVMIPVKTEYIQDDFIKSGNSAIALNMIT